MYACANRLTKIMFVSHVVVHVGGLEALIMIVLRELISKLVPCLPARVTLILGGVLKYRNLEKRLHPIIAFVHTSRKRFFVAPPRLSKNYCRTS